MIRYTSKAHGQKTIVQAEDVITTSEAFILWCQFMRGCSFIITSDTEDAMLAELDAQSYRSAVEAELEDDALAEELENEDESSSSGL